jgi:FkbM family methyltransferase
MKEFIQRILGILGFRLIRARSARKYLPKPNVDNIEIIARLYGLPSRPLAVLQIGACDGVTSDSLYPFIKEGTVKAWLVEPAALNFSMLTDFYMGESRVTLIQAAIADTDEDRPFYSIRNEGRWKDSGWARQLASFYKEHLLRHGILEAEIQEDRVRCLTLTTLMKQYAISGIDVLMVDTEGYDGEIVKMAMAQGICPNFVVFENAQLVQRYTQDQLDDLYRKLSERGYSWTHDRINTLAVKTDFLRRS